MEKDLVTVRNLVTRKVGKMRRSLAEHPHFGEQFEIVPDDTKQFKTWEEVTGVKIVIDTATEDPEEED